MTVQDAPPTAPAPTLSSGAPPASVAVPLGGSARQAHPAHDHPHLLGQLDEPAPVLDIGDRDDHLMQRRLGWGSLAALTFSGMVGSGWLFASYYAAKMAGPLAVGSWAVAGVGMLVVGLSFVELGVTRPVSGGNSRWPSLISGPFVGVVVGWVIFLQTAVGIPGEASGLLQYASRWWPWLFHGAKLSGVGLLMAVVALAACTMFNWFGVTVMARVNNLITIFKIAIPFLTVVLLIASGFHQSNVATGGGWAPMGGGAMLTAITGAGLIYSFGGIQTPALMAGEVRNPRRDIPLGTFAGFGLAFVLYACLQLSFMGAIPHDLLAQHGWTGINFGSPFAQLATLLNLGWLSSLLMVDAVVSPGGTLFMGIGLNARNSYGLAQSRMFPDWFGKVEAKSGIPRRALMGNLLVSVVFLFVFQSWQSLATALSMFFAVGYAAVSVAAGANKYDPRMTEKPAVKGLAVIAPASFVLSGLIMYWAGWVPVRMAVLLTLLCLPLYAWLSFRHPKHFPRAALRDGLWYLVHLVVIGVFSYVGSFNGRDIIPAPWDSVVVGVVSLAFYCWGIAEARKWVTSPEAARTANDN